MVEETTTPWQVEASGYPSVGNYVDKFRFFLRYAILAPSSHNTQPRFFRIGHDHLDVMSLASYGAPDILTSAGALAIRTFDLGGGIAASDEQMDWMTKPYFRWAYLIINAVKVAECSSWPNNSTPPSL